MAILCLSVETNLTIITIAVSVIGVITAITIFFASWIYYKASARKKDIENLKKVFLHTYNNEIKKLCNQESSFKESFNNFNDLLKYIERKL